MKRDEPPGKRAVSSSRPIPRPEVPACGPLRQLKELLHSLYVEASTPILGDIVKWIEAEYAAGLVPSVPSRDNIGDCIGSPGLPAKQSDAITIAGTLASHGRRNHDDAKDQARQLWVAAYEWTPLGRPIADLDDPFALEVHRAIDAAPGHTGLPVLPVYIKREHDARLGEIVQQAAAGRSAMAVLIGGSSTGKTRACWEAIQSLPEDWRLWHPLDPGRPEAVAAALPEIGARTVVWLNETQHYLLTPANELGERVAAGLRELLRDPQRGPVLVLGTIWPEPWATLTTTPPAHSKADSHAQARALLTGTDIGVPGAFTGPALTALQAAAGDDPRLAQAQTHTHDGQITQFLAGVPALLERYRNAPVAAKALIEAAMDARRLGHGMALPRALLEATVSGSLTDQQWDDLGEDWLEQAMAYTAAPCRGVRGPLSRIRPRPGQPVADRTQYRLSDYLEQHGRATRRARSTPAVFWDALVAHATREDLAGLGSEAQQRGLYRYAFQLYQAAAEAGDTVALGRAADLLEEAGRTEEAISWLQARAEAGDTVALERAADLLEKAGRTKEAITYFQRAAEAGDTVALERAADLLAQAGRTEEAITYFQSAVAAGGTAIAFGRPAGGTAAFLRAARLLMEAGWAEAVITCLQAHAEAGDPAAFLVAARLLAEAGQTEEAITYLQRAAEAGDIAAFLVAARLLAEAGQTEEAITYFQRAVEAGGILAFLVAARLFVEVRRTEEAICWLQARAGAGGTAELGRAAELLVKVGRTKQAITYFQRTAEAGDTAALGRAAELLAEVGRSEEAISWLQARAEAGDTLALGRARMSRSSLIFGGGHDRQAAITGSS